MRRQAWVVISALWVGVSVWGWLDSAAPSAGVWAYLAGVWTMRFVVAVFPEWVREGRANGRQT